MKTPSFFCRAILVFFLSPKEHIGVLICTVMESNHTPYEAVTVTENTHADFRFQLEAVGENAQASDFMVEGKLCVAGTYFTACRSRWKFKAKGGCKNLSNDSVCDADSSEVRLSLTVKRTYSDVIWELFQQKSAPLLLKHIKIHVLYASQVTRLRVNGQEVNETYLVDQNQDVTVSCSFTNGNPPVSVRILDDTGHTLTSTRNKEGPLVHSLGVLRCHDDWPTVRCEAPGSELNKSVSILLRCVPRLSFTSAELSDLKRVLEEGLQFRFKSHTSTITKCLMSKRQEALQVITKYMKCELYGSAPLFNLTARFLEKAWVEEGIWTIDVGNELGTAALTFGLVNSISKENSLNVLGFVHTDLCVYTNMLFKNPNCVTRRSKEIWSNLQLDGKGVEVVAVLSALTHRGSSHIQQSNCVTVLWTCLYSDSAVHNGTAYLHQDLGPGSVLRWSLLYCSLDTFSEQSELLTRPPHRVFVSAKEKIVVLLMMAGEWLLRGNRRLHLVHLGI